MHQPATPTCPQALSNGVSSPHFASTLLPRPHRASLSSCVAWERVKCIDAVWGYSAGWSGGGCGPLWARRASWPMASQSAPPVTAGERGGGPESGTAGTAAPVVSRQGAEPGEQDAQGGAAAQGAAMAADLGGAQARSDPLQHLATLAESGLKRRAESAADSAGADDQTKKQRCAPVPAMSPFPASEPPPTVEGWFKTQDPRCALPSEIWASRPKNDVEALESILVIERRDNAVRYLCRKCHATFWGSKQRVKEHLRQSVLHPAIRAVHSVVRYGCTRVCSREPYFCASTHCDARIMQVVSDTGLDSLTPKAPPPSVGPYRRFGSRTAPSRPRLRRSGCLTGKIAKAGREAGRHKPCRRHSPWRRPYRRCTRATKAMRARRHWRGRRATVPCHLPSLQAQQCPQRNPALPAQTPCSLRSSSPPPRVEAGE